MKPTIVILPSSIEARSASQWKNQISSPLLHKQIGKNKIKSKGIFGGPGIYSTKISLFLNNEKRYSSSNMRNPRGYSNCVFVHFSFPKPPQEGNFEKPQG